MTVMDSYGCRLVRTGIAVEILPGYQATILPRSSMSKLGVHTYTGTVDSGFVGEMMVGLQCMVPGRCHTVKRGDKIAQLVVTRVELPDVVAVDELTAWGTRGTGGWGSSGR